MLPVALLTLALLVPAGAESSPARRDDWAVVVSPGVDSALLSYGRRGMGGSLRLGALRSWHRGPLFISAGPVAHYTYLRELDPQFFAETLHLATVGGDFMVGAGGPRLVGYLHLAAGAGVSVWQDGDADGGLLDFRASGGLGVRGYLTSRVSLGAEVDVGYPGLNLDALSVTPFAVVNVHFGLRRR